MADEKKPPYGTEIAHPDGSAGVEVGGGEKAQAAKPGDIEKLDGERARGADEPAKPKPGEALEEERSPT